MRPIPAENPSTTLALALGKEAPPERLAQVLADALSATTVSRSGSVEVDTRSRLQAASLILAYQIGRPIERSEVVTVSLDASQQGDMSERLRHSPALRAAMRRTLADSEPVTEV
jgi:hypothetical protein